MDITPTPAFMEAVRQVLGVTELIPGPQVVLPAMEDERTSDRIQQVLAAILDSPAGRAAEQAVAELGETDDAAIAAAWKARYDQVLAEGRKPGA